MLKSHILFENENFHNNFFFRKIITSLVFFINNYYRYICIKIFLLSFTKKCLSRANFIKENDYASSYNTKTRGHF